MTNEQTELVRQVLQDPDWYVRRRAARHLRNFPSPEAKTALLQVLAQEEDGDVIQAAILSLTKLGSREMLDLIIKPKIMMSTLESVRWACACALGSLGSPWHFEHLYQFLNDTEWNVRNETITTLEQIISRIGEDQDDRNFSLEDKLLLLVRMLQVDNEKLQECIVRQLARFDHEVTEDYLIERLETENESIKLGLIKALGRIKSRNAVPRLIPCLADLSLRVRKGATEALGEIGGLSAFNTLVAQLADPHETIWQAAVTGLLRQKDFEFAVPVLIDSLHADTNTRRRKSILFVMGEMRNPAFVETILENLGNSYFLARKSAAEALVKFGELIREDVNQILVMNDLPLKDLVDEARNGQTILVRMNAIRALGALKRPDALRFIEELTQTPVYQIATAAEEAYRQISESIWARSNAAFVLGELGGEASVEPLLTALRDVSSRVRHAAMSALKKVKSERTVEPILEVADREQYSEIRREAVSALGEIAVFSDPVKELLYRKMTDSSYLVRLETSRVLGKIHDSRSIDLLLLAFQDTSFEVRRNALNALYSIGKDVIPPAEGLLISATSPNVRLCLLQLLGMLFARDSIPQIESVLAAETDPEVLAFGRRVLNVLNGKVEDKKALFF